MKILLITEYFPPEIGAGSTRAYEHSSQWVKNGHDVTVITGFPDYPDGIIPQKYKGYKFLIEDIEGIRVIRTYTFPAPNKRFFRRVISFISFMISSIVQGTIASKKQEILIATSPPFLVGVSGYIISKFKNIPFVFEVRDLWPESAIQLGELKNKFVIKFLKKIELYLYHSAKLIVPVAESTINVLLKMGIEENKITVIKNGVDFGTIRQPLSNKFENTDKFVVTYIGTIGLSHALDKVVESAELLKNEDSILFQIIGEGAEKENLNKLIGKLGLYNVKLINKIEREQLTEYYSNADILLVTLRKLDIFKKVIPSKLFEIMAFEKPILISVDGEARIIVEKAKAGLFVHPENPEDLRDKIVYLKNHPSLLKEFGKNGRIFVEENFDRSKLAQKYELLLSSIINQ
ncbi:MAG: glycosyltransferase family 4 protein [Bacteroidetes bacterium]|nr:glycosyltransferase family 4 protein [Bacteroidota bacterium]